MPRRENEKIKKESGPRTRRRRLVVPALHPESGGDQSEVAVADIGAFAILWPDRFLGDLFLLMWPINGILNDLG